MGDEAKHSFKPKSTEIGRINREIAKSVSGIIVGTDGAIGRAIDLAKSRERLLLSQTSRRKSFCEEPVGRGSARSGLECATGEDVSGSGIVVKVKGLFAFQTIRKANIRR